MRCVEEAEEEGEACALLETKHKLLEECFQRDMVCQQKNGSSVPNKAMREEVRSDERATLVVVQQVNATCLFIQNSLCNLAEGVQLS